MGPRSGKLSTFGPILTSNPDPKIKNPDLRKGRIFKVFLGVIAHGSTQDWGLERKISFSTDKQPIYTKDIFLKYDT